MMLGRFRPVAVPLLLLFLSLSMFSQKAEQAFTIVAFGDSITAERNGVVTYSTLLSQELKAKKGKVNVVNAGIGGNTTAHARERFEKDVLSHKPGLVIVQFGNNDAAIDVWKDPPAQAPRVMLEDYESNLVWMITKLKEQKAKVILVTPLPTRWAAKIKELYGKPPYDPNDPDGFNLFNRRYADSVRKIGERMNVKVVDLFQKYYDLDRAGERSMDDLLPDGLHPNSEGHRIEADMLLDVIRKMKLGVK